MVSGPQTIALKLEGIEYSDAVRDVTLTATFVPENSSVGSTSDTVLLTLPKEELVTLDSSGQETPVEDVSYSSDPRPQVALAITDTHIDADGMLSVTLSGEVTDKLSELAPDPSDRVQTLQFWVNGTQVDALDNLPSRSSSSGASVWRPYPFDVTFVRTLRLDPQTASAFIIRAQTTPNGAGNIGWHDVGVVLRDVPFSEFSPGEGGNATGAGSFVVAEDADASAGTFVPVIDHSEDLGASPVGSFEPMMLRVSPLDDGLEKQVNLKLNSVSQPLAQFDDATGSTSAAPDGGTPIAQRNRYYIVCKDNKGQRRILVVTFPKNVKPDLRQINPDNIGMSDAEEPNVKFTLFDKAGNAVANASVRELGAEDLATNGPPQQPQKWNYSQMLAWFDALYGDQGKDLLTYFQAGSTNTIEITHFLRNKRWDIGGAPALGGGITIQIERNTDPITAAQSLFAALVWSTRYSALRDHIPVDGDHFQERLDSYKATYLNTAKVAGVAARAYISGVTCINSGGAVAMAVYDAGDRQYAAAGIDLIPIIGPLLLRAGVKSITYLFKGERLVFNVVLAQAMRDAMGLATLGERMALIEQRMGGFQNLSYKMREALIDSDVFRDVVPTEADYPKLRQAVEKLEEPPAGFMKPQVHHELAWNLRIKFAMHGLDPSLPMWNDVPTYRWVEGAPYGPHQTWSSQFDQEWSAFFEAERKGGIVYSQEQIIDKMLTMRGSGRYRSR